MRVVGMGKAGVMDKCGGWGDLTARLVRVSPRQEHQRTCDCVLIDSLACARQLSRALFLVRALFFELFFPLSLARLRIH
jgi:hypothetical protein